MTTRKYSLQSKRSSHNLKHHRLASRDEKCGPRVLTEARVDIVYQVDFKKLFQEEGSQGGRIQQEGAFPVSTARLLD